MGQSDFAATLTEMVRCYAAENKLTGHALASLQRMILDALGGMAELPEDCDRIEAPNAVVEVIDADSGVLVRRYLELEFLETANGLSLGGEDMSGAPSRIVYLSEQAIVKMNELRGDGPDKPRCR